MEVLLDRVRRRGVTAEQSIDAAYLRDLSEAYASFFHYYDAAPLLIVNAEHIDPVGRDKDFDELVQFLLKVQTGRHYYNPAPGII